MENSNRTVKKMKKAIRLGGVGLLGLFALSSVSNAMSPVDSSSYRTTQYSWLDISEDYNIDYYLDRTNHLSETSESHWNATVNDGSSNTRKQYNIPWPYSETMESVFQDFVLDMEEVLPNMTFTEKEVDPNDLDGSYGGDDEEVWVVASDSKGPTAFHKTIPGNVAGHKSVMYLHDNIVSKEVIGHEWLHLLGFNHTQARPDRENFICIYDSVEGTSVGIADTKDSTYTNQYKEMQTDDHIFLTPFDHKSIMMYPESKAFYKGSVDMNVWPKVTIAKRTVPGAGQVSDDCKNTNIDYDSTMVALSGNTIDFSQYDAGFPGSYSLEWEYSNIDVFGLRSRFFHNYKNQRGADFKDQEQGLSALVVGLPNRASERLLVSDGVAATSADLSDGGITGATDALTLDEQDHNSGWYLEAEDEFASVMTYGDFNRDFIMDLAVGAPGENSNDGTVVVYYGNENGLNDVNALDSWSIVGYLDSDKKFGSALAAADLNGDGFQDLIASAKDQDEGGVEQAGRIYVYLGSADGLSTETQKIKKSDLIVETDAHCDMTSRADDHFGATLSVGDYNNDGFSDVAVGVPDADYGTVADSGQVLVLYGQDDSTAPLAIGTGTEKKPTCLHQPNIYQEEGDKFGASMATGDFNGDLHQDLAVGAPEEDYSTMDKVGQIYVFDADSTGLLLGSYIYFRQGHVPGALTEDGDQFSYSMVATDLNGDGISDLAVGAPFDDYDIYTNSGSLQILFGIENIGIDRDSPDNVSYLANEMGIGSDGNGFEAGFSLSYGDYNGNGWIDLAVGIPGYDPGAIPNAGRIAIRSNNPDDVVANPIDWQTVDIETLDSTETMTTGDRFGAYLP